jgi:hypothetical protein
LPDAFGVDYDLASLNTPSTADFIKRTPTPWHPNEILLAVNDAETPGCILRRSLPIGQKKQMLKERKIFVSEGDDRPAVFVGMPLNSQGASPSYYPFPSTVIHHLISRETNHLKPLDVGPSPNVSQIFDCRLAAESFMFAAAAKSSDWDCLRISLKGIGKSVSSGGNFAPWSLLRSSHDA